jgi:ATP-dependent DNA helicase DinG
MAARRRYAAADVIVTNYHLFFVDLAIKLADGQGVFPPYDLVVLDEAHQAADIARDFFGSRVTLGAIRWALRPLPPEDRFATEETATRFFRSLTDRKKQRVTQAGELAGAGAVAALLGESAARMEDLATRELVEEVAAKTTQCASRARAAADALLQAEACSDPDRVVFVERAATEHGFPAVCMKPIRVAPLLSEALFDARPPRAIVATSATLTTSGDFGFMEQELGAYEAETLQVPSPFDHRGAALLVVPTDLPDPRNGEFAGRVSEVLVETVRAARGRTLGLFTSYRVLDEAHRALVGARLPYRVLRQGEAPRTRLIEQFRDDVSSVLLGTSSFWEGIDVQGESLSAVLIDRLPFDHPEDPVLEAISERDRNWFMRYSLPRSIISFRQGFGRLIRSRTDRGVIVVCDRRIVDKPYGSRFVRSLPAGVRLVRSLDAAAEVLG